MVLPDHNPSVSSALTDLKKGLTEAKIEMALAPRAGAMTALQAMIGFVQKISDWEAKGLCFPLTILLSALNDLNSGRTVPLLQPKEGIDNRRPDSGFKKVMRAASIHAAEQLQENGMGMVEACKFVADILKRENIKLGGRTSTPAWRTVRGWRYDTTRRGPNDQEAHTLAAFRAEARIPEGLSLEQVKSGVERALVAFLRELALVSD
jgi:hypothetical protein